MNKKCLVSETPYSFKNQLSSCEVSYMDDDKDDDGGDDNVI